MKRLYLFEIHDHEWCPRTIRDAETDYLQFVIPKTKPSAAMVPILAAALQHSGSRKILDLCSVAGWIFLSRNVSIPGMSDVTRILDRAEQGDPKAAEELLPLVYDELRRVAAQKMASESPGQTLQPTALVHEAWLKLAGSEHQQWKGRGHFFAAAAEAMRRILIDNARRKNRVRHGKGLARVDLDRVDVATEADDDTLLHVDEALARLAAEDPIKAELVKLRYFAGLSIPEAGQALGLSESTTKRYWAYARAWLYEELKGPG